MEQESWGVPALGGKLGAALQELGCCGAWHMVAGHQSGCMPCWALCFPSDCRAFKWLLICKQLHLGNGAVWVQKIEGILDLITPLAHACAWCQLSLGWVDKRRLLQREEAVRVWWQWLPLLCSSSPETLQPAAWENCTWHSAPSCFCISLFLSRNSFCSSQV